MILPLEIESIFPGESREIKRLRIDIQGAVQGVGFRPFVYRLAHDAGLAGWVSNSAQGVQIEIEGAIESLREFVHRLEKEKPVHATIQNRKVACLDAAGYSGFVVRESDRSGDKTAFVLPDIATCPDCMKEIFDSQDRRFRYPFTNCTNCGPRYSIIETLPYDRSNTSMKIFPMCDQCRREYEDPSNRRFHAQPNACPKCGPHLELWDIEGKAIASGDKALSDACEVIREGRILALKGLGGFQLLVDARKDEAVKRLRRRKNREEKPLAMMYPDLNAVMNDCEVSELERKLLCSFEAPIVLLRRLQADKVPSLSPSIAPGNPYLGIMLPYTPLHHLLMSELKFPIIATSGNISDEPICIDEKEAVGRLGGIAHAFLIHNRPIIRQVDDSVVRVMAGREMVIRNARGYAPSPVQLGKSMSPTLAVGAHLKNSAAIAIGKYAFLSQHIGDLETAEAYDALCRVVQSLSSIYDFKPESVVSDLHPDYLSTKFADGLGLPGVRVQHHYAHVRACMADNQLDEPALGVSWDGTGFGPDGTIWGGEFLKIDDGSFSRVAHLRPFRLPGGEAAIRESRRSAIGLLYEIHGNELFSMDGIVPLNTFDSNDKSVLQRMLAGKINSPITSSAGRLFDAVASIIGICHVSNFEGQAAMQLEFTADGAKTEDSYRFAIDKDKPAFIVNWEAMICSILDDLNKAVPGALIAAKFHNTLSEIIVEVAGLVNEKRVILTGGCFQNKYLTEQTIHRLGASGFEAYWHRNIPPNDGGIALGQLIAASHNSK